jgi:hypothetical protein
MPQRIWKAHHLPEPPRVKRCLNGDPSLYLALFADRDDDIANATVWAIWWSEEPPSLPLASTNESTPARNGSGGAGRSIWRRKLRLLGRSENADRAQRAATKYSEFSSVRVTSIYERMGGQWRAGPPPRAPDPISPCAFCVSDWK